MMIGDLRFASRQFYKAPGFCMAVIFTLALGIGVNTAVFSIVYGLLLRKPPYPQPDRIAALVVHREGVDHGTATSEDDDSFDGSAWQLLKANADAVSFASWGGSGGVNMRLFLAYHSISAAALMTMRTALTAHRLCP